MVVKDKKVLVLEADDQLRQELENDFKAEGYTVLSHVEGRSGLQLALEQEVDAVVVDMFLPELNGMEVTRRLHQNHHPYILMLSERTTPLDAVSALDVGADDYVTKPFETAELLARVRAAFRRVDIETSRLISMAPQECRDLRLDPSSRVAKRGKDVIKLTDRESSLLHILMVNRNKAMSREVLREKIWQSDEKAATNIVDVYVRYLREKIDVEGQSSYIATVRGVGYMIRDDQE